MSGRRSLAGIGQASLIYTIGTDDPYSDEVLRPVTWAEPILTASVGEDFADCQWPVTIKAKGSATPVALVMFMTTLAKAVHEGFYMDPNNGNVLYWRWDGRVPPGVPEPPAATKIRPSGERVVGTGRRSAEGEGPLCAIYLMDERSNWEREDFHGRYQGETAISGSVDEDFAVSSWPVVVKIQPGVTKVRLEAYLRDFAAAIENGMFYSVDAEKRALR